MFLDDPFPPGLLHHLAPELLLIALGLAFALLSFLAAARLKRRAQTWSAVTGHVESVSVTTDSARGSIVRPQMVDISYSYVAGGERYAAFESLSFRSLETAEACAAQLRDSDIAIRYNPKCPQESTIDFKFGDRPC